MLRKFIACVLVVLAPAVMTSAQTGTAVLYGTGSVYLNGAQLSNSLAVTAGDVIQTKETGAGNLNGVGVSVVIQSNTIVRSQSGGLSLDRGSVSVATGNGFNVFARDFKIVPTSSGWTEFYISRASGVIQIIARKNAISVSCGPTTSTIKEGQQVTRDDAADCGIAEKRPGAVPAATAPILTSTWAEIAGVGAGGALLGWVLAQGDDPVSPYVP
jgi:hypothetical protein